LILVLAGVLIIKKKKNSWGYLSPLLFTF
jgi:hypothetical protein